MSSNINLKDNKAKIIVVFPENRDLELSQEAKEAMKQYIKIPQKTNVVFKKPPGTGKRKLLREVSDEERERVKRLSAERVRRFRERQKLKKAQSLGIPVAVVQKKEKVRIHRKPELKIEYSEEVNSSYQVEYLDDEGYQLAENSDYVEMETDQNESDHLLETTEAIEHLEQQMDETVEYLEEPELPQDEAFNDIEVKSEDSQALEAELLKRQKNAERVRRFRERQKTLKIEKYLEIQNQNQFSDEIVVPKISQVTFPKFPAVDSTDAETYTYTPRSQSQEVPAKVAEERKKNAERVKKCRDRQSSLNKLLSPNETQSVPIEKLQSICRATRRQTTLKHQHRIKKKFQFDSEIQAAYSDFDSFVRDFKIVQQVLPTNLHQQKILLKKLLLDVNSKFLQEDSENEEDMFEEDDGMINLPDNPDSVLSALNLRQKK